jgi:hypothetical protein
MADRYIPEHRRTQFKAKNTFKPEELRRRREEQQVEIRKAKREENLAKRRGIAGADGSRPGAALGAEPDSDDDTAPTESQVSILHVYSAVTAQRSCDYGFNRAESYFVDICLFTLVVGYCLAKYLLQASAHQSQVSLPRKHSIASTVLFLLYTLLLLENFSC